MFSHTLTVSTAKIPIPDQVSIDFITSLINRGVAMVEYFGPEIDNCEDYVEEDMKLVSGQISYFEFYFSTEQSIDYDALTETEVDQVLFDAIDKSDKIKLQADQKDIMIYL